MPVVPKSTKCGHLGCKQTRSRYNSYCLDHGGKNEIKSDKRIQAKQLYNDKKWHSVRSIQLGIQPLCQSCLVDGHVRLASDVDHVFAWNSVGNDSFLINLFQSLCHSCHSLKTGLEQKGIYRYYKVPDYIDYAIEDYHQIVYPLFYKSSNNPPI